MVMNEHPAQKNCHLGIYYWKYKYSMLLPESQCTGTDVSSIGGSERGSRRPADESANWLAS